MRSERLAYIDVAKGLLIMIVVIHHMPHISAHLGISDFIHEKVDEGSFLYSSYFMPAFFIITGYCSRAALGSFVTAFLKNLKQIILPAFTLGAISVWIDLISHGVTSPIEYCKVGFSTLIFNGGPYWFLSALFVAKMIYWSVERYSPNIVWGGVGKILIYILLAVVGCVMNEIGIIEVWYVWHAFMLCLFLSFGRLLRQYGLQRKVAICSAITFIVITSIYLILGLKVPYVTASIQVHPLEFPVYLILALSGSIIIMYVSQKIGESGILQFYGRNSLIVYGLHIAILFVLYRLASRWLGWSIPVSLITFAAIFVSALAVISIFIRLLNLKYLRYTIGKF